MTTQRLEQAKLDVSRKTRANLFNWRGQFTPELIEHLLDCYATPNAIIADPFSGNRMSPDDKFPRAETAEGELFLSVLSAEVKVNYDKTMFQECCGTASRLKQGCPSAKYFVLVEFLDMEAEDSRLTDIDNVFLPRHAKRLPSDKRSILAEVEKQHKDFPIDGEIVYRFVQEIENFLESVWHDPAGALKRGSFI